MTNIGISYLPCLLGGRPYVMYDEDRSSGSLDCLTQVRCEALVPLRQSVDWSGTVSKPSCSQSSGRWMRYLTSAVSWLHPWSSFGMNMRKRVSIS